MRVAEEPKVLSIRRLTDAWISSSIRPNPEYQRGSTWRRRQQQLLIDSVFRGYPLPRFYFQQKTSVDVLGNTQVGLDVIDGQQRLIALSQFRQDKWALFDVGDQKVPLPASIRRQVSPWSGKTFSSLPDDLQREFLDVSLSVVLIDQVSGDEVRDLFIRLQAGTPLTSQQVRDAWPGAVGPFIERLAGKGDRQGQYQALFQAVDRRGQGGRGDVENQDPALDARQTCAQLLLLLLAKERGRGYPSLTSAALNDLYHENTGLDEHGREAVLFQELLTQVQTVVQQRPAASGRKTIRKNRVFSLFLFMRLLRFSPVSIKHILPDIAALFWSGDEDDAEPVGRVASSGTLEKHFLWFVEKRMAGLRASRFFSPAQKVEIWNTWEGKCGVCGEALSLGSEEYDHIKPWVLGGRTSIENGRPVHVGCHARGVAALGEGIEAPLTIQPGSSTS